MNDLTKFVTILSSFVPCAGRSPLTLRSFNNSVRSCIAAGPGTVVPFQLPPDTPDFTGRREQVDALRTRLRAEDIDPVLHPMIRARLIAINDRPVLVNVEVVKTENVFPMVPAGAALEDMIIEPPTTKLEKPTGST